MKLALQIAIMKLCYRQIMLGGNKTLKIGDINDLMATHLTFFLKKTFYFLWASSEGVERGRLELSLGKKERSRKSSPDGRVCQAKARFVN